MWVAVAASVRGTSHVESNTDCQDSCELVEGHAHDAAGLVFSLSDGAGSAKHSEVGSRLITGEFCQKVKAMGASPESVGRETVIGLVREIRASLVAEAAKLGCEPKELAATVIGGCISEKQSWFFQIGDGAIAGLVDDVYTAITWPINGEYANSTVFLTSSDWEEHAQFVSKPFRIAEVAAFTDGMQDLILQHSDRSVHAPFLRDMFGKMRALPDSKALVPPLRGFLDSKAVNERTDDDKTLVLACWID